MPIEDTLKRVGTDILGDFSEGATKVGYQMIGQVFENAGVKGSQEIFAGIGANVSARLKDRTDKYIFDNFRKMHIDPAQNNLQEVMVGIKEKLNALDQGIVVAPDGTRMEVDPASNEAMRMRNIINRDAISAVQQSTNSIMEQAVKYKDNPYVNQHLQQVMTNTANTVQGYFQGAPGEPQQQQVKMDKDRAQIELLKAQAAEARAGAKTRGKEKSMLSREKLLQGGMGQVMSNLLGSKDGRAILEGPVGKASFDTYMQTMLDQNPALNDPVNAGAKEEAMLRYSEKAQKLAAGSLASEILGPVLGEELQRVAPEYFLPKRDTREGTNFRITGRSTATEQESIIQDYKVMADKAVSKALRNRDFKNVEDLIQHVKAELEYTADQDFAPISVLKFQKQQAIDEAVKYIKNNWHANELAKTQFPEQAKKLKRKIATSYSSAPDLSKVDYSMGGIFGKPKKESKGILE